MKIAVAIRLTHHGLGAIVFPFNKAIGDAGGKKAEKGQDFGFPIDKSRKSLMHRLWPRVPYEFDPGLELFLRCLHCLFRIPVTQRFFEWTPKAGRREAM